VNNPRGVSSVHEPVNGEVSDALEGVEDEAVVVLEVISMTSGLEGLGEVHESPGIQILTGFRSRTAAAIACAVPLLVPSQKAMTWSA